MSGVTPVTLQGERREPAPGSFSAGYQEGRSDLVFALANRHQWAVDLLKGAFPWRPIESAPKDRTRVLVWRPTALADMTRVGVDYWQDGSWWHSKPNEQPTHWMHVMDVEP